QPGQRGQDLVIHPNIASMTEGQNTQFIRLCLHHFMRAPIAMMADFSSIERLSTSVEHPFR
ncbi:MAG: hypothetical protein ACLQNE_25115, partial [Thermoguttaceae bacterium]